MRWFKRNEIPIPVKFQYVIPDDIRNEIDHVCATSEDAKNVFAKHIKTLSRVELLQIEDSIWFKENDYHDRLWEAMSNEQWERNWPLGKINWLSTIPDIIREELPMWFTKKDKSDPDLNLNTFVNQVAGIQKAIDVLRKLLEDTEVTLSTKTALKLMSQ